MLGIDIYGVGVAVHGMMEVTEECAGLGVGFGGMGGRWVKASDFMEGSSDGLEALGDGVIIFDEGIKYGLGEFDETGGVVGLGELRGQRFLLAGVKAGGLDLADLVLEEVALSCGGRRVAQEILQAASEVIVGGRRRPRNRARATSRRRRRECRVGVRAGGVIDGRAGRGGPRGIGRWMRGWPGWWAIR